MTDDDIKSLREALANPALHDPDASSTDTWEAVLTLFKACNKDRVARLLDEIERLRAELARYAQEAIDDIDSWSGYASPYFRDKHDLEGTFRKWRTRAAGDER